MGIGVEKGMAVITVDKKQLIATLVMNREAHAKKAAVANEKYRNVAIIKLTKMLNDAKEGGTIHHHTGLTEPSDHTKDYDRVINMLKWSQADSVAITEREFAHYVEDSWEWKRDFDAVSASYGC